VYLDPSGGVWDLVVLELHSVDTLLNALGLLRKPRFIVVVLVVVRVCTASIPEGFPARLVEASITITQVEVHLRIMYS